MVIMDSRSGQKEMDCIRNGSAGPVDQGQRTPSGEFDGPKPDENIERFDDFA